MSEAFNESSRTITCVFDDGPVRVYVDYYKVGDALVKVVGADTLEQVCCQCGAGGKVEHLVVKELCGCSGSRVHIVL